MLRMMSVAFAAPVAAASKAQDCGDQADVVAAAWKELCLQQ